MAAGRRLRRIGVGLAVAFAAYLLVLLVAGLVAAGPVARTVRDRLAASLDGTATVDGAEVGLIRGQATVTGVTVERRHLGVLRLAIDRIEVDVAPLGAVVIDREPRAIRLRGGQLLISGAGALDGLEHRDRPPIHVGGVTLTDCELTIVATTLWPELARVHLAIERVEAGPTTFRTPLSWIFSLRALAARVELPGGIAFALRYQDGALTAQGSLFGDDPITVPIALAYDPRVDEPTQLRAIAVALAERLIAARARSWLGRRALGLLWR